MIFFCLLMVLVFVAQIAEFFIPPLDWMSNAHVYIAPVLVFYGAMALPLPLMLVLVFWAGFLLDALTAQVIGGRVEISFGSSILLYAVLAGIMHGLRPLFARGRWEVHCIMSGVCTSALLLGQYLMISFRRGSIFFSREVWWQIGGPGLLAMIMAPLVFWALHWLARADRLSLSAAARTHMNRPRLSPLLRLQFLGVLMLLGLGALAARLWWVQVARGAEWTARIRGSSEATVRIPSIRGEIRDRNGTSLVQNRASYEVDFYLPEMVKGYRQRYGQPPLTVYRGNVSGMPKDLKEADIVKIVNDGIVPRLDDLDLARDYNAGQLQKHYRNNTEVPYTYIKDIDFPTMAKFSEHDVGLPGVDIAIKPVRSYVYGALAAHLLGYVGAPDDTNKEEAKQVHVLPGRRGGEIERRENNGRISERQTGCPLSAA